MKIKSPTNAVRDTNAGLRPLHDYCPRELRVWGGAGGRAERVSAELLYYDAQVVCTRIYTLLHIRVCVCVCV